MHTDIASCQGLCSMSISSHVPGLRTAGHAWPRTTGTRLCRLWSAMRSPDYPVTDDHIHIDPLNGRGIEAAKDFLRAGGTHLFLVSKPSWSLQVYPSCGADYSRVFDETLRVAG